MSVSVFEEKIVTTMLSTQHLRLTTDDNARISAANFSSNVLSPLLVAEGFNKTGHDIKVKTVSANYTVAIEDEVIFCDTSGGAFTVNMPQSSTIYNTTTLVARIYKILKITADGNTVTIDPYGSETINTLTNLVLSGVNFPYAHITTNGSNLFQIG